jgi:hypothetical protein
MWYSNKDMTIYQVACQYLVVLMSSMEDNEKHLICTIPIHFQTAVDLTVRKVTTYPVQNDEYKFYTSVNKIKLFLTINIIMTYIVLFLKPSNLHTYDC